jgi:hypothetical protein
MDSSSFSVDTTSEGSGETPSDGGSSGGGSVGGGGLVPSFDITSVSAIVSIGEEKSLSVVVQNKGRITANKCALFVEEGFEDYIESEVISNIGVGEIAEFSFVLNALDWDVANFGLELKCLDSVSSEVVIDVIVLEYEFGVEFDSISFLNEEEILVEYSINPNANFDEALLFNIVGSEGEVIDEKLVELNLVRGEVYNGEVVFDVGSAKEGLLKINVFNSGGFLLVEEPVIYGSASGITGFVALGLISGESILVGVIVIVFLVISGFVIFRIMKLRKGKSPRIRDTKIVRRIKSKRKLRK